MVSKTAAVYFTEDPNEIRKKLQKEQSKLTILVAGQMGTGKSTWLSNLTGQKLRASNAHESITTKVGLVSTNTLHALDLPGTNDTKTTGLHLISLITSALAGVRVDGIFIAINALSYRISDELLQNLLLIASLVDWEDNLSFRKKETEEQHAYPWFVLHQNKPKLPIFFVFTHCDQIEPDRQRFEGFISALINMTGLDKIFTFESRQFLTTCGKLSEYNSLNQEVSRIVGQFKASIKLRRIVTVEEVDQWQVQVQQLRSQNKLPKLSTTTIVFIPWDEQTLQQYNIPKTSSATELVELYHKNQKKQSKQQVQSQSLIDEEMTIQQRITEKKEQERRFF